MEVSNIFELVNKFNKEEDQISASFGFILKNHPKILKNFLDRISIKHTRKELKKVDIETQVPYDSGESRIDLQLKLYGSFLIFLESKLYRNEKSIITQLKKYARILSDLREEYNGVVRLIYVNKFEINEKVMNSIERDISLKLGEFYFLSWEDLIQMVEKFANKTMIKLFKEYVGDKMYSKKIVNEQRVKDLVEVLVIHTNEENWELITKKHIAVQANGTPDAKYIAFYRTHRRDKNGKKLGQAITHVAEVLSTETNVKRAETIKGVPSLRRWYKETGREPERTHKQYHLGNIIKLAREIPFIKGGKSIGQVKFKTKMSELLRVDNISELKRLKYLQD